MKEEDQKWWRLLKGRKKKESVQLVQLNNTINRIQGVAKQTWSLHFVKLIYKWLADNHIYNQNWSSIVTTRLRLFAIQIPCIILPFIRLLGLQRVSQRVPTHQLWMVPLPTTTPCTNSTRRRNSSRRGPSVFSMRFSLQSHAYPGGSHQRDGWYWDRINSRIIPTIHMLILLTHMQRG